MKGIDPLGLAAGVVLIAGGLVLLLVSIFLWPVFFYGLIALILGIVTFVGVGLLRKE